MTTETQAITAVALPSGVRVVNATPHSITFRHGEEEMPVPPCGLAVSARAVETVIGERGAAQLVTTLFEPTPAGEAELEAIETACPGALVVGSIISAQAYRGRVVAMTPAPGFERVPPAEKRMSCVKFTIY